MEVAAEVGAWTTLGMEELLGQSADGSPARREGAALAVAELSAKRGSAVELGMRGGGKRGEGTEAAVEGGATEEGRRRSERGAAAKGGVVGEEGGTVGNDADPLGSKPLLQGSICEILSQKGLNCKRNNSCAPALHLKKNISA